MQIQWEENFLISIAVQGDTVTICANHEGMVSLANILLSLATQNPGTHIHLDENNSLEDGSCELIIERIA